MKIVVSLPTTGVSAFEQVIVLPNIKYGITQSVNTSG
jgi:hypothetical protein